MLNKILTISFPNANDWNAKITGWVADLYAAIHAESPSNKPESNAMVENALQSGYASKNVKGELQFSSKIMEELEALEGYTLGEGFWNMTAKWDSEKIAKAIDWYLKGDHSADEIARRFNLSMEGVNPDLPTPTTVIENTSVGNAIRGIAPRHDIYERNIDDKYLVNYDIDINVDGNMDNDVADDVMDKLASEINNPRTVNIVKNSR